MCWIVACSLCCKQNVINFVHSLFLSPTGNYTKKSNPKLKLEFGSVAPRAKTNPTLTKHMLLNYAAFEIEFQPALTHFREQLWVEVGIGARVGEGCRAEVGWRKRKAGQSKWGFGFDSEERQIVIYVILFAGTYTQRIRKWDIPSLFAGVVPLVNLTAIKFAYISIKCRTLKAFPANKI